MNSATPTLLVLIATYNERQSLPSLIDAILAIDPGYHVLIIDDNSPDGTAHAVRSHPAFSHRLTLLSRPAKLGYGSAIRAGFSAALDARVELIATMDADWSHDPAALPQLVAAARHADVVLGSRYLHGVRVLDWALSRLLISITANRYVRLILSLPFADCTSGYRLYRRQALADIDFSRIRTTGYAFLVEILYRLARRRHRIVEYPIVYSERRQGQSKMSWNVIFEAVFAPWRMRLRRP